jgi:hypothetical protein
VLLCQKLDKAIVDKLIFQLRYLYMDDPLAYSDVGVENPDFCTQYDLKHHLRDFYDLCARRMAASGRKPFPEYKPETRLAQSESEVTEKNYPRLSSEARPLSVKSIIAPLPPASLIVSPPPEIVEKRAASASWLVGIERDLAYADLHKTIRRQPVCAMTSDLKIRRVFDELYINIAHLRQTLRSDVDFLSNRWLFKYLTHMLDERMLDLIGRYSSRYLDVPISLNLNVETLLSSAFTQFDALIKPEAKVSIVIEVPVVDVFADMSAFMLARDDVQKLGYRVCLDGLSTVSFTSISREKLGVDLVKMQWNAELKSELLSKPVRELAEAVRLTGSNRVILCRCDNKDAVQFGHALGISLFQGRYIDGVHNPNAKIVN